MAPKSARAPPPRRRRRRRLPPPRPLAARDRGARPARDSDGVRRARRGALVVGRVVAVRLRLRRLRRRRGRPRARDGVGAGGAVGCVRARVRVSARDGYLNALRFGRASRDPSSGSAGISSIPKHHKRAVRPSPHRRLWNRRRRARRSSPRTRRRDASFRVALSVDTEPEEEPIRAANSGVSAAFLQKADGWYEPWNLDPSQTSISFDPSSWREVFVPLDRALFFTGEPKAEVSWNRLSWRDVSVSAERSSSATSAWSRGRDARRSMTIPANPTRLLTFERPTTKTARAKRRGVTASTSRRRPLRRRRRSRSQKRSHKKGRRRVRRRVFRGGGSLRAGRGRVRRAARARRALRRALRRAGVRRGVRGGSPVAPRRAARRCGGAGEKDEERGGEEKTFGARRRLRKASTPPAFRLGSIPSPRRRDRFGRALLPARRAGAAAWPEARGERIRRGRRVRGDDCFRFFASEVFSQQKASAAFAPRREKRRRRGRRVSELGDAAARRTSIQRNAKYAKKRLADPQRAVLGGGFEHRGRLRRRAPRI